MAAQALRRYVSTPPDNLAWQFRSICSGGPGDMVGMCQRPAPQKMLRCRGGSHFFDHDLVGFGALPSWRRTVLTLPAVIYRASECVWA